jgi:nucleotide-binding universal stress UspA family protein
VIPEDGMTTQLSRVFETIMVAYDGSPQSLHATNVAFSLAEALHSKLLILAVIRLPKPAIRAETHAILDEARDRYEQSFASLRERAQQKRIELDAEIAIGHPAEQIVHHAESAHVNLIIMGRGDISALPRWMHGSISNRVVSNARCPVMIIH